MAKRVHRLQSDRATNDKAPTSPDTGSAVHRDGSCLTVTGATISETYGGAAAPDGAVARSASAPLASDGGLAVLKGNLCPDGALIKVAGLAALIHEGPARVFECEERLCSCRRGARLPGGRGA